MTERGAMARSPCGFRRWDGAFRIPRPKSRCQGEGGPALPGGPIASGGDFGENINGGRTVIATYEERLNRDLH